MANNCQACENDECYGHPREDYEKVVAERDALREQVRYLRSIADVYAKRHERMMRALEEFRRTWDE
jgi:hypothetical protein